MDVRPALPDQAGQITELVTVSGLPAAGLAGACPAAAQAFVRRGR